jgi:hypothetical protein
VHVLEATVPRCELAACRPHLAMAMRSRHSPKSPIARQMPSAGGCVNTREQLARLARARLARTASGNAAFALRLPSRSRRVSNSKVHRGTALAREPYFVSRALAGPLLMKEKS